MSWMVAVTWHSGQFLHSEPQGFILLALAEQIRSGAILFLYCDDIVVPGEGLGIGWFYAAAVPSRISPFICCIMRASA